jgi:hypothetical protein
MGDKIRPLSSYSYGHWAVSHEEWPDPFPVIVLQIKSYCRKYAAESIRVKWRDRNKKMQTQ